MRKPSIKEAILLKPDLVAKILRRSRRIESGCLEWQGTTKGLVKGSFQAYGSISIVSPTTGRQVYYLVHRVIFVASTGWEPKVVMHTCDNPSCVEIGHLIGGTQKDNMMDMAAKGR